MQYFRGLREFSGVSVLIEALLIHFTCEKPHRQWNRIEGPKSHSRSMLSSQLCAINGSRWKKRDIVVYLMGLEGGSCEGGSFGGGTADAAMTSKVEGACPISHPASRPTRASPFKLEMGPLVIFFVIGALPGYDELGLGGEGRGVVPQDDIMMAS